MRCKFMLTERARKKASRIPSSLDIDHERALQLCLGKDHVVFSCDVRLTQESSQSQLMSEERLCVALGRPAFHTPQPRQPEKGLGVEPLL